MVGLPPHPTQLSPTLLPQVILVIPTVLPPSHFPLRSVTIKLCVG
jgi:hypothetical protein